MPLLLAAFFLFQAPIDLDEMRVKTATKATEMNIGRAASRRFERQIKLIKDMDVLEYVGRITQKVAASSDVSVPVTIKVVDDNTVNALSFPGGFLYVTRGLIMAVDDEAEIAGVIAHEIAHVVVRDGMKNSSYLGTGARINPAAIPSPEGTDGLVEFGGYLIPRKFVAPPRETDADRRGIPYMQRAGYDPRGLITFLQKMQAKEKTDPGNVWGLYQTHPPTADRIRLVEDQLGALPATPTPQVDTTSELKKVQSLLRQTVGAVYDRAPFVE
jgi:predicted Zn-dependent protease